VKTPIKFVEGRIFIIKLPNIQCPPATGYFSVQSSEKQLTLQTLRSSTCVITLVYARITMATTYEAWASTNYRQTTNWDYEVTRKPQIQPHIYTCELQQLLTNQWSSLFVYRFRKVTKLNSAARDHVMECVKQG
jgi:hypothetical protein